MIIQREYYSRQWNYEDIEYRHMIATKALVLLDFLANGSSIQNDSRAKLILISLKGEKFEYVLSFAPYYK